MKLLVPKCSTEAISFDTEIEIKVINFFPYFQNQSSGVTKESNSQISRFNLKRMRKRRKNLITQ